ncbi:Leucyl-tRNA synthetase, mitochondrial [Trapelia coarctata]|nr:Leucyl-tRNA synthetase, mitochondrial [Trapelia coarctata]
MTDTLNAWTRHKTAENKPDPRIMSIVLDGILRRKPEHSSKYSHRFKKLHLIPAILLNMSQTRMDESAKFGPGSEEATSCQARIIAALIPQKSIMRFEAHEIHTDSARLKLLAMEPIPDILPCLSQPATASIDRKWQKRWENAAVSRNKQEDGASKAYILSMFPYPSGTLHMGHLRVYTIVDVLARFKRMQGYNVLNPMGWDAFGLPAENAAIERGIEPAKWTRHNVRKMKLQLTAMNGGFDWSRELMTCDPSFYKHTQRIFLLLHDHGLAYQAESLVNFDPVDRTVLANEQVDANGFSWRSGAKVEKVSLRQWFFKVTAFKEALLKDLDSLGENDRWPERVLAMQRNWVGKSEGATIRFPVQAESEHNVAQVYVQAFTTRPDTLVGVQYLALSLAHPLVVHLAKRSPELQGFLDQASLFPESSKAGYLLPEIYVKNPLSVLADAPTSTKDLLPVYVAPYVLQEYGEGAVMGVPGHDARDNEFWKQHRPDQPVRQVIRPGEGQEQSSRFLKPDPRPQDVFTKPGILTSLCGNMEGLTSQEATGKIISELEAAGKLAQPASNWKLRDWLISRQRYWGTPIPIIHCRQCGAVPVPVKDLPVELPKLDGSYFLKKIGNPLESAEDWVNTTCPRCTGPARRDTDTMDTFVDSSWYFMRYVDPRNASEPFSPEKADEMLPVDVYIGGIEHAILHLLYARFISKFLASISLWPSGGGETNKAEPFKRLITQGMVHGKTYSDPQTGRFLKPEEVDLSSPTAPKMVTTGETPTISWEKMSKSKYNGVDPSTCIEAYGADVTRAHMLFQAPVSQVLEWEEERIVGIQRWFGKLFAFIQHLPPLPQSGPNLSPQTTPHAPILPHLSSLTAEEATLFLTTQSTITSITTSLSTTFTLNTLISDLIKLTNILLATPTTKTNTPLIHHSTSTLLRLLAPVAPAFAEECWELFHSPSPHPVGTIFDQPFPVPENVEVQALQQEQACAVQENGKLRFAIRIPKAPESVAKGGEEMVREWVLGEIEKTEEGARWIGAREGREWKRVVVVSGGRVVNFVG